MAHSTHLFCPVGQRTRMAIKIQEQVVSATNVHELETSLHELHQASIEPLYAHTDMEGYAKTAIRGVRNHGLDRIIGGVGSRYAIVNHEDIMLPIVDAIKAHGISIESANVYQSPTDMYANIIFEGTMNIKPYSPEAQKAFEDGDMVSMGIRVKNSFNGTSPVSIGLYGQRLACANGMMTDMKSVMLSKRHTKNNIDDIQDSLKGFIAEAMEKAKLWTGNLESSQSIIVDFTQKEKFLTEVGFGKRQVKAIGTLAERYANELGHNAWAMYNAATDYITHTSTGSQNAVQRLHGYANKLLKTEVYA